MDERRKYKAVAIGVSAGGLNALSILLPPLPERFAVPVVVVQHVLATADDYLVRSLDERCRLRVKQAEDKESPVPGAVYFAPPGYHLMMETDETFSLSVDEPVRYARPSIDVFFETAADAYGNALIGVVLTGANADGSEGLKKIKQYGGYAVVQDPAAAESPAMPRAAIGAVRPDRIATLEEIADLLVDLCGEDENDK